MHERASELLHLLALARHPEGGRFREIFRSPHRVMRLEGAPRSALTTIYFLLAEGEHSRWHRVDADEIWHHYEGGPLVLFVAEPETLRVERQLLGPVRSPRSVGGPRRPIGIVPAGHWQAAQPLGVYALAGCTVAPGFERAGFELLADSPGLAARIREAAPELAHLI